MALNIKSGEADRLARELAAATGENLTTAVTLALKERLERVRARPSAARRHELEQIFQRAAKIPPREHGTDEELLGYNAIGAFD